MDMTMEHGYSSGDSERVLRILTETDLLDYEETIWEFLQKQPASFEPLLTDEEVMTLIRAGHWSVWLYLIGGEAIGIALLSQHSYGKVKTVKVEFLSCKHFFQMAELLGVLEDLGRQEGIDYIEAIAHPTIASYGVMKRGFSASGVYIRKPLKYARSN